MRGIYIGFGTLFSIVAIGWQTGLCVAQEGKPTIEQILQVWMNRQKKVSSARFELSCEQTIPKGSVSYHEEEGLSEDLAPSRIQPPRDYMVRGTTKVTFSGEKLRYFCKDQAWNPSDKQLYAREYLDVFDGRLAKNLISPVSTSENYPMGNIAKAKVSQSALQFSLFPLILTFRGNHPQFYHGLGKFRIFRRDVAIAGHPCLELVSGQSGERGEPAALSSQGRYEVLFLDKERDYVVLRKMTFVNNKATWHLDVAYVRDDTAGWVPQSWEYLIRAPENNQLLESERITVTRYEMNPLVAESEFDISFPPGTRVVDDSAGTEIQYVIREDGEKGRGLPSAVDPTYEALQRAASRSNRLVLLGFWTMLFFLAFGGWIWLRRFRHRNQPFE